MSDLIFKLRVLRYLLIAAYEEWRDSVWKCELDSPFCCDGYECGCGASTVREKWGWHLKP